MKRQAVIIGALVGTGVVAALVGTSLKPVPPNTNQPIVLTRKCISIEGLPDANCTPGAVRTSDKTAICDSGSTSLIRPTTSYTTKLKKDQFAEYSYQNANGFNGVPQTTTDFEEDHLISLELGGDPKSPLNLWPEPWNGAYGAHTKDLVENETHKLVCTGKMDVVDAQTRIAKDWKSLGQEEGVIK